MNEHWRCLTSWILTTWEFCFFFLFPLSVSVLFHLFVLAIISKWLSSVHFFESSTWAYATCTKYSIQIGSCNGRRRRRMQIKKKKKKHRSCYENKTPNETSVCIYAKWVSQINSFLIINERVRNSMLFSYKSLYDCCVVGVLIV